MDGFGAESSKGFDRDALLAAAELDYGPWVSDEKGRLTYVHRAFLDLLGRPEDRVLGEGWFEWLAPEVQNLHILSWRQAIELAEPFEQFHAFVTASGERRSVWVRANPVRDDAGNVRGWAGLHLKPPEHVWQAPPRNAAEEFLENTTEGFVAMDREFRFTYVNRVAAELTQRPPSMLIGQSHWEIFPTLVGTQLEAEYRRVLETGAPVHFEFHIALVDLWLEVHAYPSSEGLAVFFRDVSRRKRAETRLHTALTSARAGIWEWDVALDALTWSPEMFGLLGVPPSVAPTPEQFLALLSPEDRKRLSTAVQNRHDPATEVAFEIRLDEDRWVEGNAHIVRGEDGQALRLVGLAQDVSERRSAEAILRSTQNSLALAMKGGRMGYWTRRLDPDTVTWSPELEALFGLEPGSFHGDEDQFLKFVLEEDLPGVVDAVQTAIRTGQEYSMEFRFRRTDGSMGWMEGRGRATYDDSGKPTWLYGLGLDITERKESEARYRRLASLVPCIVWATDREGRTHFVNDRWSEVTGCTNALLTREDWARVIHPEDQPRLRETWRRASESGTTYEAEVRYLTRSGGYRWFLERAEPVLEGEGGVAEWFGTSVDVHDLRVAQEGTRQLLDSMPQLAWSVGADGRLEFINGRYMEYSGMTDPANRERSWGEVVHPDDRASTRERYDSALRNREPWESEMRLRRHDGVYRWHLSRLIPIRDEAGDIVRWFGASTDIHRQKMKELALDFLVRLTEATRSIDDPGEIIRTMVTMLGEHLDADHVVYSEIEGEDQTQAYAEYDRRGVSLPRDQRISDFGERCAQTLRSGRSFVIADVSRETLPEAQRQAFDSVKVMACIAAPIFKSDHLVAIVSVTQSIPRAWTQDEIRLVEIVADRCWADIVRVRADRDLRDLNAELERRVEERTAALVDANREMEGFTYTVSHDLRAPLRAIMATSMILLEEAGEKLAAEERALLSRQAHNAKHLGVLIDDLLKLSRLSRQEMRWAPFDLSELAQTVATELKSDERSEHVAIEIQEGMQAVGDPKLMSFVLLNLMENACKFSPRGGKVRIGRVGKSFYVADEGIGFDTRYAEKLFLPFERLVGQEEYPGTGIGLANVKRIIDRHGGRVWAESTLGKGSTFWFTIRPEQEEA